MKALVRSVLQGEPEALLRVGRICAVIGAMIGAVAGTIGRAGFVESVMMILAGAAAGFCSSFAIPWLVAIAKLVLIFALLGLGGWFLAKLGEMLG